MSHVHALAKGYSKQDLSRVSFSHGRREERRAIKNVVPINALRREITAMGTEKMFSEILASVPKPAKLARPKLSLKF